MILPSVPSLSLFCIIVDGAVLGTILASASLPRMTFHARNKHAFRLRVRSFARSSVPPSASVRGGERAEYRQFVRRRGEEGGGRAGGVISQGEKIPPSPPSLSSLPLSPLLAPTDGKEGGKGSKAANKFPPRKNRTSGRAGGVPPLRALPPSLPPIWASPSARMEVCPGGRSPPERPAAWSSRMEEGGCVRGNAVCPFSSQFQNHDQIGSWRVRAP